jgi:hypothetical protein
MDLAFSSSWELMTMIDKGALRMRNYEKLAYILVSE